MLPAALDAFLPLIKDLHNTIEDRQRKFISTMYPQIIANIQLNSEDVWSVTAFQGLLKAPNQFIFLRKKI